MKILGPYPDFEAAVLARTAPLGGAGGTVIPDNISTLAAAGPYRFVYRFAGVDDGITDTASIGVDILAARRSVGFPHAQDVVQRLIASPWTVTLDGVAWVIDDVVTLEGPQEVPYGDTTIRRWVTSFNVAARRRLPAPTG